MKNNCNLLLSGHKQGPEQQVAAGQVNPSGNQRDHEAERLGPVTCSSGAGKKGWLLPTTKQLLLSQGTRKPQNYSGGYKWTLTASRNCHFPFAYAKQVAQLHSQRALYSCQVSTVNTDETWVGQPARHEHLIQGKNTAAVSSHGRQNPIRCPPGSCSILKSSRKKPDVSLISNWFGSTFSAVSGF